ncbi:MAG: hypothetical protein AAF492_23690, partial [Verrucomicrobiota bacterium]
MKAIAPGKVILSGEHAVVYGKPALVTAVNRYIACDIQPTEETNLHLSFPELKSNKTRPMETLADLQRDVDRRYARFLEGTGHVTDLLEAPIDLMAYTAAVFLNRYGLAPATGLRITLDSQLSVGCGMGSSAAAILALLTGLAHHFAVEMDRETAFALAMKGESIQHGKPSGVDPWVCLHGGCIRFQHGEAVPNRLPPWSGLLIQTGQPASTTGECVMQVADRFHNNPIWNAFETTTESLQSAMIQGQDPRDTIRTNHRLLCDIGVTPIFIKCAHNMPLETLQHWHGTELA